MESKFIEASLILQKDWNLFRDLKSTSLTIAERTAKYTKEYGDVFFDVVVLEDEAEFLVHAKEPFTKKEAIEWIKKLDFYKENYSEPILKKNNEGFVVLVSMPNSIYKHQLLKSLIEIGCDPIVVESCFDIYEKYDELVKNNKIPETLILSEEPGVLGVIKNHLRVHPETKIIGLTGNINEMKITVDFVRNGAKHVIMANSLDVNYIYTVFNRIFPNVFIDIEDDELYGYKNSPNYPTVND